MITARTALVGCGNISSRHLDAIKSSEKCSLAAVCDIVPERADSAAERYGAEAFYDFDRMLKWGQFDVVHICTPHYLHAPMAIKAMREGKHVLTEKPLAITYEDALEMCRCAEENNVRLGVCFQNRYNEQSVFIKNLIDGGELGTVTSLKGFVTWDRDEKYYNADNWHGTLEKEGGGVVINQAIHTIDLLAWFSGGNPESVTGSISQKRLKGKVETEDTADALIKFDNGVQALFYGTLCNKGNSPVFVEVKCEKGKIVMYDEISVYRDGTEKKTVTFQTAHGKYDYWGNSHSLLIEDFYSSVLNNTEFSLNGREGLKSLKIVSGIYSE
ncbi:MAG: Gfo/Idh/MocA family oxidoreductase [Clostridiales bacterium]|nr:Gfo/Idh/MocA family oxidoreductase [Clostridiales bacterium]